MASTRKEDRLFNPHGRRHYRRTYNINEVRIGVIIVAVLVAIAYWVAWRGMNPDPELFSIEVTYTQTKQTPDKTSTTIAGETTVFPSLDFVGWEAGPPNSYTSDNLYEKINGREGFYKSYGFKQLYTATLANLSDPNAFIDIELFDLGSVQNAFGAYNAERPTNVGTSTETSYIDRNLLGLSRNTFYLRAIGSLEDPKTHATLTQLKERFVAHIPNAALPWSHELFMTDLGLPQSAIGFEANNAFSFEFGKNVHIAQINEETELFIIKKNNQTEAQQLAYQFLEGFLSLGTEIKSDDKLFVQDRYLHTYATAESTHSYVIGVRGAPTVAKAQQHLNSLTQAIDSYLERTDVK